MSFADQTHKLRHDYVRAVEMAGGVPVLVPAIESESALNELFEHLDGLVITGGPAITDGLIGELPGDLSRTDPVRVAFDKRIAGLFLDSNKPILGICYGMQLLNALDGGTLVADVERQHDGALPHSPKRGGGTHSIRVQESTRLFDLIGENELTVNSRHIQAIAQPGRAYRVAAVAPDGVIEAIESADGRVLGVQFHPERLKMISIFESLTTKTVGAA